MDIVPSLNRDEIINDMVLNKKRGFEQIKQVICYLRDSGPRCRTCDYVGV